MANPAFDSTNSADVVATSDAMVVIGKPSQRPGGFVEMGVDVAEVITGSEPLASFHFNCKSGVNHSGDAEVE